MQSSETRRGKYKWEGKKNQAGKCSKKDVEDKIQVIPIGKTIAGQKELLYAVQIHIMISQKYIYTLRQKGKKYNIKTEITCSRSN